MKHVQVLAVATLILLLSACSTLTYSMTGIVAESSSGGSYAFSNLGKAKIEGKDLIQKPSTTAVVEAGQTAIKLDISQVTSEKTFDYSALFGPPVGSGASAQASLQISSDPAVRLDTVGWVWAWRTWPIASIRWVSAAAQGSTVVIEMTSASEAWVYYLDGTTALPVVCLRNKVTKSLGVGRFIIVKDNTTSCDFGTDDVIPTVDPGGASEKKHAFDFIDDVKPIAKEAGWPF